MFNRMLGVRSYALWQKPRPILFTRTYALVGTSDSSRLPGQAQVKKEI